MSGAIEVSGLVKSFDATTVLRDLDLSVQAGELLCVVGPSGSGKTTLLRCLAGLETPDQGTVLVAGEPVVAGTGRTALVFQQDTLFPELTVAENVGFGLRARGVRPAAAAEAVTIALLRLGLTGLEERLPVELSGGQQRRVALARALVLQPSVLLLDEPLAGLDEGLTHQGLRLIRTTQQRLGLTTVLVTHDQSAALAVADRLVVLEAGRIAQIGSPRSVFARPDSVFVAQFIGQSAFLEVEVERIDTGSEGLLASLTLLGESRMLPAHPDVVPGPATVLVRPHTLRATAAAARAIPWREPSGDLAMVQEALYLGDRVEYIVETAHGSAVATGSLEEELLQANQVVRLQLAETHTWVLPTPH